MAGPDAMNKEEAQCERGEQKNKDGMRDYHAL
jgi:hypothetical protein